MRKSIFARINDYSTNPLVEYYKIYNFLDKNCYYNSTIYSFLENYFQYSKLLTKVYEDLDTCINENSSVVFQYKDYVCENVYNSLEPNVKEEILNEYLTFCEVLYHLFYISIEMKVRSNYGNSFNYELYCQTISLMNTGLKALNYSMTLVDEDTIEFEATKINPEAENIANESSADIRKCIYHYLGSRDNDYEEKNSWLHKLIDFIEPLFKKYKSQSLVSKCEEYSQLLRHPEIYKNKDEYMWFYKDLKNNYDKIFDLCIFTLYYDKTNDIKNEFETNKLKSVKTKDEKN